LNRTNNLIIGTISDSKIKELHIQRNNLITTINNKCKEIKPSINKSDIPTFNNLIKKYLFTQQNYYSTNISIQATQLILRNPTLTMDTAESMIKNGHESNLCMISNESLNYVQARHKQILKLEKSLQELHELFIAQHAIVEEQNEKIDNIQYKVSDAKNDVKIAKSDLGKAYKFSK
jgi:t-SNARE complex subunit (syntaxin)